MKPSEKPNSSTTPKLIKITPSKPTNPTTKYGEFEEPLKAPHQKQVWVPKPNHLKIIWTHFLAFLEKPLVRYMGPRYLTACISGTSLSNEPKTTKYEAGLHQVH